MLQATQAQPSLLDELIPRPDHREHGSIAVKAPARAAWAAVRAVTAEEIFLYRTMTWLRRLGRPTRYSSLQPPSHQPLLEAISRNEFSRLGETAGAEVVIGALIVAATGELDPHRWKAREFVGVNQPGFVKLAVSFSVTGQNAGQSTVALETRLFATDRQNPEAAATAWRRVFAGKSFLRRMWLRAIQRRAEAG